MRSVMKVVLALSLALSPAALAGEEKEFSEVEYYKNLAEKQLAEAQLNDKTESYAPESHAAETYATEYYEECIEEKPANAFVVIPQYFHARNDKAKFKVGGNRLEMAKGRANGAGTTVLYNRTVTDWFSFALMYEYGFLNVTSGVPVARGSGVYNRESSRWHSHVVGFLPEFNFGDFGRLQLSVIQGFDRASGSETVGNDRRDIDDYGTDVTSLMAWYQKDFQLGCSNWKLTPYAGWRSLYVKVKDANDWNAAPGTLRDDNTWVHLASGGFKLSYQQGAFGFNVRGGVSHRTSKDDVPGYGNRAVAPGVVHFSHRANLDKTVGTAGAAVTYAINRRAIVSAGYDGYYGKDTSSHMGSLSFIFPF